MWHCAVWWQSAASWRSTDEAAANSGEHSSCDCEGRHLDEHRSETTQGPGTPCQTPLIWCLPNISVFSWQYSNCSYVNYFCFEYFLCSYRLKLACIFTHFFVIIFSWFLLFVWGRRASWLAISFWVLAICNISCHIIKKLLILLALTCNQMCISWIVSIICLLGLCVCVLLAVWL